ncbi:MAG: tetratricopeptide repeat protein [Candidatus Promineifilaceae bacterium]
MDIESTLARAKELRQADELDDSLELLEELLSEYPEDPHVLFEVGGAYDVLGLEAEAIPHYKNAVEEGLEGGDLQECLICLGSCHRAIGEFQESVDVLEALADKFPDNRAGLPFLALAYYSNQNYKEAVSLLLDIVIDTSSDEDILAYVDPLDYYRDHLDEVWDD